MGRGRHDHSLFREGTGHRVTGVLRRNYRLIVEARFEPAGHLNRQRGESVFLDEAIDAAPDEVKEIMRRYGY